MDFKESKSKIKKLLLQDLQNIAFREWLLKLKEDSHIIIEYDLLQKIS